jgi:hypothetical protein
LKKIESPKSIAFKAEFSLLFANKKFSGFKSLCMTPFLWQAYNTIKLQKHKNFPLTPIRGAKEQRDQWTHSCGKPRKYMEMQKMASSSN